MIALCPKCRTRLKIKEQSTQQECSRFKCPECSRVILLKKSSFSNKKSIEKVQAVKKTDKINNKAEALARSIISGIFLSSLDKADSAIIKGDFREAFAPEISQGLELYQKSASLEAVVSADLFDKEIEYLITARKKGISL